MPIDSKRTFVEATKNLTSVIRAANFADILSGAGEIARALDPAVTSGALNNVRGDWFEWLITLGSLEFMAKQKELGVSCNILVSLPNVSTFDCATLYVDEISNYIDDLKRKTEESSQVSLVTSNPDYAILSVENSELPSVTFPISEDQIISADRLYQTFVGRCEFSNIVGYASVKVSLRPDRRLQLPHEGSLMKAIYRHIQTRLWMLDAPGIKYYAATSQFNDADRKALRTVATHSIINVNVKPEAAIDELFEVPDGPALCDFLQNILTP